MRERPRFAARIGWPEPIGRSEDIEAVLDHLLKDLCAELERAGLAARRLDLMLFRLDGKVLRLQVGAGAQKQVDVGDVFDQAMVRSADVRTFIASEAVRAVGTILPAAEAAEKIVIRESRDMKWLARKLLSGRKGAALVAGHSNTVPELLKELGVEEKVTIAEDEYDHLFVVTIPAGGSPTLLRLRIP